ncbi:hypothetical protein [Proteiniphilum acetatigenes]|uniref:hypothetical protein n=1 Tax=Proteiniphilum acetatigenes TaxID=294710 RepID=UPI00039FA126|nr:hypothetical protein [Proteiniphilum acetatigenes]
MRVILFFNESGTKVGNYSPWVMTLAKRLNYSWKNSTFVPLSHFFILRVRSDAF